MTDAERLRDIARWIELPGCPCAHHHLPRRTAGYNFVTRTLTFPDGTVVADVDIANAPHGHRVPTRTGVCTHGRAGVHVDQCPDCREEAGLCRMHGEPQPCQGCRGFALAAGIPDPPNLPISPVIYGTHSDDDESAGNVPLVFAGRTLIHGSPTDVYTPLFIGYAPDVVAKLNDALQRALDSASDQAQNVHIMQSSADQSSAAATLPGAGIGVRPGTGSPSAQPADPPRVVAAFRATRCEGTDYPKD